jgi:AraC-like DNA-binding protein
MSQNILYLIAGLGIVQGIFLTGLIFFHPKGNRRVNFFLALYVFCFAVILTVPFMMQLIGWENSFWIEPFPILLGPSLYLYILSFKEEVSWRKAAPHMVFFFSFFFIAYGYYSYLKANFSDPVQISKATTKDPYGILFSATKIAWFLIYYFITRQTLIKCQRSVRECFSDVTQIDLRWARLLNNGTMLLIVISVLMSTLIFIYPEKFTLFLLINVAVMTPYLYVITYIGITQSTLWRKTREANEYLHVEVNNAVLKKNILYSVEKTRSPKAGLSEDRIRELADMIIKAIEKEKLFTESELSLQDLANKIRCAPHQASQAINEGLKKSFYDVINGYRVEEAKRLLIDPKNMNYTILSVGFEAGFNSKTTFNTVFKKFTGVTPTEYRDKK